MTIYIIRSYGQKLNRVMKTIVVGFNFMLAVQTILYLAAYLYLPTLRTTSQNLDAFWLTSQLDEQICQLLVILAFRVYFSMKRVELQINFYQDEP